MSVRHRTVRLSDGKGIIPANVALGGGKMSALEEEWVTLYRTALLELEHAKMSGRIEAARMAIVARTEKLQNMPGLHPDERQAIADALSGLRVLQYEETRYDSDQKRRAAEQALEKLRDIAPTILRNQHDKENPE
jgi:hypothetical protein